MSANVDKIKRKLLIKYPPFGSVIANLNFQADRDIETAGTDGKVVLYNPDFLEKLSEKEQIFLFAHEVCHVAFEHIFRSEGKDKRLWNTATDAVINALLKQDGLPMIEGGVDIPEAVNYDAEEMYNKLLEEKKKEQEQQKQGQQNSQQGQGQQDSQENQQQSSQQGQGQQNSKENQQQQSSQQGQGQQDSQENQQQNSQQEQGEHSTQENQKQNSQSSQTNQEQSSGQPEEQDESNIGHDTHDLWEKAIEERKREQQEQEEQQNRKNDQASAEDKKDKGKDDTKEKTKFSEQGERETFKQMKIERKKQLQELSKELANQSSHEAGDGIQKDGKQLSDIGIAAPLIDWRRLLRQAVKYDEEWTRKNARMRNGYFRHRVTQVAIPETEILLDTSGSVSEVLLKNFLRECKNILDNSKVKVGCFNTEFHGFTELKRPEDIDIMSFPIGGGTDFDAAVGAFSRQVANKIIFTDGLATMPKQVVRNVIWVVFGDEKINPIGGKVINITGEQLERLYQSFIKDDSRDDKKR